MCFVASPSQKTASIKGLLTFVAQADPKDVHGGLLTASEGAEHTEVWAHCIIKRSRRGDFFYGLKSSEAKIAVEVHYTGQCCLHLLTPR